jgi:hypothetical protein
MPKKLDFRWLLMRGECLLEIGPHSRMLDEEFRQFLMRDEEVTILWACILSMTKAQEEVCKIGSRGFFSIGRHESAYSLGDGDSFWPFTWGHPGQL